MKHRFLSTLLAGIIMICLLPLTALARPAFSRNVEVQDADGRALTIRNHGDEFFSYLTDENGNLIHAHSDGYYYYVVKDDAGGGLTLGGKVGGEPRNLWNLWGIFRTDDVIANLDHISVSGGIGPLRQPLSDLRNTLVQTSARTGRFFALRGVTRRTPDALFNDDGSVYTYTDDRDPLNGIWFSPRGKVTNPPRAETCALLVLMIDFEDVKCLFDDAAWHTRIFDDGVSSYFTEVSNGRFTYVPAKEEYSADGNRVNGQGVNDGVIHVTLPIRRPGYSPSETGQNFNMGAKAGFYLGTDGKWYSVFSDASLFAYAAVLAGDYIDFSQYDRNKDTYISPTELAIMVVLAGQEASYGAVDGGPMSWAHSGTLNNYQRISSGSNAGRVIGMEGAVKLDDVYLYKYTLMGENINPSYHYDSPSSGTPEQAQFGTPCHELGHDLGLMDLYDTTYTPQEREVLSLSLMANGCDGMASPSDPYGNSPTMLDAYSKVYLGFCDEQVVTVNGLYHMNQSSDPANANILRVNTDKEGIYYLIENRTFTGYDKGLAFMLQGPGGLVYWRINEAVTRENWYHNTINSNSGNYGIMPEYTAYQPVVYSNGYVDYAGCNAVSASMRRLRQLLHPIPHHP